MSKGALRKPENGMAVRPIRVSNHARDFPFSSSFSLIAFELPFRFVVSLGHSSLTSRELKLRYISFLERARLKAGLQPCCSHACVQDGACDGTRPVTVSGRIQRSSSSTRPSSFELKFCQNRFQCLASPSQVTLWVAVPERSDFASSWTTSNEATD